MIKYKIVDIITACRASIANANSIKALGLWHYKGNKYLDNKEGGVLYINRMNEIPINNGTMQL